MNKKLITLAVAAAMVAPLAAAADTTLYGRLDTALVYGDDDTNAAWDIVTNTTRMGVKGSEDLGNGLKAIFQAEWSFTSSEGGSTVAGSFNNRLAYAGLTGGFGTVAIGRQWTPYYGSVGKFDIFNGATSVSSVYAAYSRTFRTGNALAYVTPNFNGLQGKLALVIDRTAGLSNSDGVDAYNLSVDYNNGPISVGISTLQYNNDLGAQDLWGLSGSYKMGMFKLVAMYENIDDSDVVGATDGSDNWNLGAEVYFGNNTVRAMYGQNEADNSANTDTDFYALGFQHNFSKRTRVYVEYIVNDFDNKGAVADVKTSDFSFGLRHDF